MSIEHKDIAAIREDYIKGELSEENVVENPFDQFKAWFSQALEASVIEPNAMVISTVNSFGFPSSRVVLLKDIKEDGFSFFTNYNSDKAKDILTNPHVSILFFWAELQRQVRIEGFVEKLPAEDSDEYFQSRPKGSRIGAWASPQSAVIANRDVLVDNVLKLEAKYASSENIDRPDFWGGFLIKARRFEFWQGRSSRLHDRLVYEMDNENWELKRLAP